MGNEPFITINVWTMLFTLCNLLLLCWILKKFLYKPVQKVLRARQDEVDTLYRSAEDERAEAQTLRGRYEDRMRSADAEAERKRQEAADEASRAAEAILADASRKAERRLSQAEEQIARDRAAAVREAREEIAGLALLAAGRIVERELTADDHTRLIEETLASVPAAQAAPDADRPER